MQHANNINSIFSSRLVIYFIEVTLYQIQALEDFNATLIFSNCQLIKVNICIREQHLKMW